VLYTRRYDDILNPGLPQRTHPVAASRKFEIFAWISTLPYTSHHRRINEQRLEGTGTWLFDKKEYCDWRDSSTSKLLLLRGIRKSQLMLDLNSCLMDLFSSWGWKNLYCVSDIYMCRLGTSGLSDDGCRSKVIDAISEEHQKLHTAEKLAYFYCNRAEENRREPESILNTLIQQLAQADGGKS
jgi:hypothetical protein